MKWFLTPFFPFFPTRPASTTATLGNLAKRALRLRTSISRHSQLFRLGLFLFAGFIVLPAYASSPEDDRPPQWKEVLSFAPVNPGPVTWCGPKILVVKEYDLFKQAGGIVHINVETKKVTWVTKNPLTKDPFCNYDGTTVFYHQLRENPKIEPEGLEFDGVWAYDLKTKRTWKIGNLPPDKVAINLASPAQNIYALVARDKKYFPDLKMNLPGWQVLRLPTDDRLASGIYQWARDGSYLVLSVRNKDQQKPLTGAFVFLDPNGHQLSEVSSAKLEHGRSADSYKALGDGLYFFDGNGDLRRVNPLTGGIEVLPLHVTLKEKHLFTFDVSPTDDEVVYNKLDGPKPREWPLLWLTSVSGGPGYSLGISAFHPRFSPTSEYLAVIQRDKQRNGVLTVMQRSQKSTDR